LGIAKNGLVYSPGFLADFSVVDIFFADLASADER
jgi:hypothetical protein